jgi:hypothetical protein
MFLRAMATGKGPNAEGIVIGSSKLTSSSSPRTRSSPVNTLAPQMNGGIVGVYQTTFYPSTTTASQATPIRLKASEERTDVDVMLRPTRAAEVSGILMDDAGPVGHFGVHLMPADMGDGSTVLEVATTTTDPRGGFVFPLVPAGNYIIRALRPRPVPARGQTPPNAMSIADRGGAWAAVPVAVADRNVGGIVVTLRGGVRVSGRYIFRGSSTPPSPDRLSQLRVIVSMSQPLFRDAVPASVAGADASGAFSIDQLSPGRYAVRIGDLAPTWTVESMSVAGRDATDGIISVDEDVADMEIVFTDRPAAISGVVRGATLAPDSTASVLLFPTDRQRWRDARGAERTFVIARTRANGAFTLANVPPGNYLVAAVADTAAADWPDQKFLEKVAPLATSVHVTGGQAMTIDLMTMMIR